MGATQTDPTVGRDFLDDARLRDLGGDRRQDRILGHAQQVLGRLYQCLAHEEHVAVVGGGTERVHDTGFDAIERIFGQADGTGDAVGGAEAYAPDVLGKPVWVVPDHPDGLVAVSLVDLDREGGGHPVTLKEDHDVLDFALLGPSLFDALDAVAPEARNGQEALGLVREDVQDLGAERRHQLVRGARPHALDEAGAQVLLDSGDGGRHDRLVGGGLELCSELGMHRPRARAPQGLADVDRGHVSGDHDEILALAHFDLDHREPRLGAVVRDVLEDSFEFVHLLRPLGKLSCCHASLLTVQKRQAT